GEVGAGVVGASPSEAVPEHEAGGGGGAERDAVVHHRDVGAEAGEEAEAVPRAALDEGGVFEREEAGDALAAERRRGVEEDAHVAVGAAVEGAGEAPEVGAEGGGPDEHVHAVGKRAGGMADFRRSNKALPGIIARSIATKQSPCTSRPEEIAARPSVARNDSLGFGGRS